MRIIDFFGQGVSYYPDNTAFCDQSSEFTYAMADREARKIAGAIRGNGFQKGDRIGVYSPNSNLAFLTLLGLMRSEAVWLPINPRNSTASNIDLAERFGMSLMFYSESFNQEVQDIKSAATGIQSFVCIDGKGFTFGYEISN